MKNKLSPVVKWVGGKRQLLPMLLERLPNDISEKTYVEPFFGGGALLFSLQPKKAIINDINEDLILLYKVIQSNVDALIYELKQLENTESIFYYLRDLPKKDPKIFDSYSNIQKAARTLYLNKTCFNGLYRVNKKGFFNTPYCKDEKRIFLQETKLLACAEFFNKNDIKILCQDYKKTLRNLNESHFVYLDPPYDKENKSSFVSYTKYQFSTKNQKELKDICKILHRRNVKFMQSNALTSYIENIYKDDSFYVDIIRATRMINCKGDKRGFVPEVIIKNYKK